MNTETEGVKDGLFILSHSSTKKEFPLDNHDITARSYKI